MKKLKGEWLDLLKTLLIVLGVFLIIRTFLFLPIVVDGPSMKPTLHNGDQMVVNRFIYDIHEPDRFDVVVFHASEKKDFIKRVIGLPGEHITVKDDQLYVDGDEVEEPFLQERKEHMPSYQTLTNDFDLEQLPGGYETIPDNHVLVLGDNRNNSTDSRILGLVSMDKIIGKASLVYWPLDRFQLIHD
ncbi:signal peptidase I [Barrientosiimonas marina]|uniref:Signal peptidase I n=1 Tax=Lentibacillus kimchii TaxID=1542911 RepID=A0ABW2UPH9_9BACI